MTKPSEEEADGSADIKRERESDLMLELENIETTLIRQAETLERKLFPEKISDSWKRPVCEKNSPEALVRVKSALERTERAQEMLLKRADDLEKQLMKHRSISEEVRMERDALQERVFAYLEVNSSLKSRLEEQRCGVTPLLSRLSGDPKDRSRKSEEKHFSSGECKSERTDGASHGTMLSLNEDVGNWEDKVAEFLEGEVRGRKIVGESFAVLPDRESRNWVACEKEKSTSPPKSLSSRFVSHEHDAEGVPGKTWHRPRAKDDTFVKHENAFSPTKRHERSVSLGTAVEGGASAAGDKEERRKRKKSETRSSQLRELKHGLANISKKLNFLKSQLIVGSASMQNKHTCEEGIKVYRNLKRKAAPLETTKRTDQSRELDSLKDILDDAKKLNAKLQNLREEKQESRGGNDKQ